MKARAIANGSKHLSKEQVIANMIMTEDEQPLFFSRLGRDAVMEGSISSKCFSYTPMKL